MKFQTLHINHFGHFADFDLSFGDSGILVLYGQNEAGKTTLLEFLRQLLFGIDERTPYSFGDGGEVGGTTRFVLSDNRVIELRRRKGRKNTVQVRVDGKDTEFGEAGFHHLLGHADKEVFQSVFAFGLDELRRGNEALRHESLQSALFGGGLGGAFSPEKLLQDFDNQAGELFKSAASKPTINALSKVLGELAKEIKQKAIRSDDYERCEEAWEQAQSTADQLSRDVTALRVKHSRTDKLVRAWEPWIALRGLKAERLGLIVPVGFPSDARHQFDAVTKSIERLTGERDRLEKAINAAEKELCGIELDKTLLPLKADIEDCHRLIQSVSDARDDLPKRREEQQREQQDIQDDLKELRPGWTLSDLKAFTIDKATRASMDNLRTRHVDLNELRAQLLTRQRQSSAVIDQHASDLAALGESRDVSLLADIVERASDYTADQKALKKLLDETAKLEQSVELLRPRFSPPLADNAPDVWRLPVPRRELVTKFDTQLRDGDVRVTTARDSLEEERRQLLQIDRDLSNLDRGQGSVPKLEELNASRSRRDVGWELIRSQHIDGKDRSRDIATWLVDTKESLPDAYERAVADADDVADQIYANADAVARREQLKQRIEQVREKVARKEDDLRRAENERRSIEERWNDLWQACGFSPDAPDFMKAWLDDHEKLVELHDQLGHLTIETTSLRRRLSEFEASVRSAFGATDDDVVGLLSVAKQQVKAADEDARQRKQLERDRKRSEKQLEGILSELHDWDAAEAAWQSDWRDVLQRLRLPADWDADLASNVVERLLATKTKLANLETLATRITDMENRLKQFDPRVRRLCESLAIPIDADRPEVTARSLHARLTEATRAHERRSNLEASLADARKQHAAKETEHDQQVQQHERLLLLADTPLDAEFRAVAERAERAVTLDTQIAKLTLQLDGIRGNEDANEFEAKLCESDSDLLQATLRDLATELDNREKEYRAAVDQAGGARQRFGDLDGRDDAARLQEDLACKQAQLASEIHRYVPLVFAKKLLQQAIKRFERDNQPEMIGRISKLFATMTGGRYVEIERPTSDRNSIYVRRTDGAELTPDQLSTGTREQLYLAIRLGYVLHYCRQAEPLPIVMDDVLVNFDDDRSRATLEALRDVSREVQVLFFTCHQHFVDLIGDVFPDIRPIELPTRASGK